MIAGEVWRIDARAASVERMSDRAILYAEVRSALETDDELTTHTALRRGVHAWARRLRTDGVSVKGACGEIGGEVQAVIAERRADATGRTSRATEIAMQVDRWVLEVYWPQLPT
jgi:hypothetical protein